MEAEINHVIPDTHDEHTLIENGYAVHHGIDHGVHIREIDLTAGGDADIDLEQYDLVETGYVTEVLVEDGQPEQPTEVIFVDGESEIITNGNEQVYLASGMMANQDSPDVNLAHIESMPANMAEPGPDIVHFENVTTPDSLDAPGADKVHVEYIQPPVSLDAPDADKVHVEEITLNEDAPGSDHVMIETIVIGSQAAPVEGYPRDEVGSSHVVTQDADDAYVVQEYHVQEVVMDAPVVTTAVYPEPPVLVADVDADPQAVETSVLVTDLDTKEEDDYAVVIINGDEPSNTRIEYTEDVTSFMASSGVEYSKERRESSDSAKSSESTTGSSGSSSSTVPPAVPVYNEAVVVVSGSPGDPEDPVVVESVAYTPLQYRESMAGYMHAGTPESKLGYAEAGGSQSMSDQYVEQPAVSQTVIYSQPGPLTLNNNKSKELDMTDKEYWFKAKSATNMNWFFAFACIGFFINIPLGVVALFLVQKGRDAPTAAGGKRFGCYSFLAVLLGICITTAIIALCILYAK